MANPFQDWLELQLELQIRAFGNDPRTLTPEDRAVFMVWNAFAVEDELHEAMQEVGWKPWATDRSIHNGAFLDEIVDALHFLGNMILAAAIEAKTPPWELAEIVWQKYQDKVEVNIQRQKQGYTGLDKCTECHRDLVGNPDGSGLYCPQHPALDQKGT